MELLSAEARATNEAARQEVDGNQSHDPVPTKVRVAATAALIVLLHNMCALQDNNSPHLPSLHYVTGCR